MIIGRYCVDPSDICAGSINFDPETSYYRVGIECLDGSEYVQAVIKKADADKLLKQIDKAIFEGAGVREEGDSPRGGKMKGTKVYICGPITGVKNHLVIFDKAYNELKALGYEPVNPCIIGEELADKLGREPTYDEFMAADLEELAKCNHIYLLPGWENSKGARIEWAKARKLAVEPIYLEGDYEGIF